MTARANLELGANCEGLFHGSFSCPSTLASPAPRLCARWGRVIIREYREMFRDHSLCRCCTAESFACTMASLVSIPGRRHGIIESTGEGPRSSRERGEFLALFRSGAESYIRYLPTYSTWECERESGRQVASPTLLRREY